MTIWPIIALVDFCKVFYLADSALQVDLPYRQNVCDSADLRTSETYNTQLQRIAKNSALQKVYWLKKMSCLNSITDFHVISGLP